eukprot:COSAG02_NODE_180_length_31057_cov_21.869501_23_plen_156_part_00
MRLCLWLCLRFALLRFVSDFLAPARLPPPRFFGLDLAVGLAFGLIFTLALVLPLAREPAACELFVVVLGAAGWPGLYPPSFSSAPTIKLFSTDFLRLVPAWEPLSLLLMAVLRQLLRCLAWAALNCFSQIGHDIGHKLMPGVIPFYFVRNTSTTE